MTAMTDRRGLITDGLAASCYFRTSVPTGQRKALVQITERCNLHCAHCFVSAGDYGDTMRTADITSVLIPRLGECRVPGFGSRSPSTSPDRCGPLPGRCRRRRESLALVTKASMVTIV